MKEDAQLVCPISYDDPDGHWDKLQQHLLERLPLRDVTWKSPISSSFITIARLPLRFLPSSANLFKDTDHSFRWFLSPYVYVYILGAETLESYKAVKPSVKKWVDSHNLVRGSLGRSPWLIIYLPLGNYNYESYAKVYSRICSDFYVDKVGDRSVMLMLPNEDSSSLNTIGMNVMNFSAHGNNAMMLFQQSHNSFNDLLTKLRDGVVMSFQHRSALYDSDIRRLDSTRGSPTFDFRQLFLVKESLALLYQMMQLSDMALAQYEELEAILPFAPLNQLPDNDWPLIAPEPFKTGDGEAASPLPKEKEKDLMTDAVKNGDDIVVYSINLARMKILKNKMSLLELHRYVFARQMFFLITLQRPVNCAQKGLEFLKFCSNVVEKKVQTTQQVTIIPQEAGPFSVNLRMKQTEVWALTSAIKILRVCRDLIKKIFNMENGNNPAGNTGPATATSGNDPSSQSYSMRQSRASMDSHMGNNSSNEQLLAASAEEQNQQSMDQTFRASTMLNERMFVLKESFVVLSEIMEFANNKLAKLTPIGRYAKSLSYKTISEFGQSYLHVESTFLNWFDSGQSSQQVLERERKTLINAMEYFNIFCDAESAKSNTLKLQKELELLNANDINLDQMLVSVSQRIRTASHYWAKLYGVERYKPFDYDDRQSMEKYIVLSDKANCTRLQVEVGRTLEISIYTLMNRSLAEIHAFCDRWRFSNLAKLDVISTLLSTQQHVICSRLLQDLLYGPITAASSLMKDAAMLASSINSWPEIKMWALQALLLASLKTNDVNSMKQSLGWLSLENVGRSGREISDWVEMLIELVPVPVTTTVAAASTPTTTSSLPVSEASNGSICSLNVMPAESFLNFSIHLTTEQDDVNHKDNNKIPTIGKENSASSSSSTSSATSPVRVKGYEMIQEEMFPVSVFQYVCEPNGHFLLVKITSKFTKPLVVDRFALIFKKLQPEIFQAGHQGGVYGYQSLKFQARDESSTAEEERDAFVANLFTPLADEFVCDVPDDQKYVNNGKVILLPGEQMMKLTFSPSSLGEYGLDRIVISKKSLLLFSKVLTNCSDWSAFPPFLSPSLGSSGGRRPWGVPSTPMGMAYNSMDLEHMPYSPIEIQSYFDKYSLIKIQEPKQLVSASVNTSNISPPYQIDYCSIVLNTLPEDLIEDMVIHVSQKEESKKISREIKSRLSSISPSSLSIRAIHTPNPISQGVRTNHDQEIVVGTSSTAGLNAESVSNRWKASDLGIKIADPEEWSVNAVNKETGLRVEDCEVLYDFYFSNNNVHIGDINGGSNMSNSNSNNQQHFQLLQQQLSQHNPAGTNASSAGAAALSTPTTGYEQYEDILMHEERRLAKCLKLVNIAANSSVMIRIPFIAFPQCDYRKMQDIIFLSGINVTIEGRLRRGGCSIPFQINASNNISCGLLLTGSARGHSHGGISKRCTGDSDENDKPRKMAFVQTNLHNLGPEPVSMVGYSFLHSENNRWNLLSKVSLKENDFSRTETTPKNKIFVMNAPKDLEHFDEISPKKLNDIHKYPLIKVGEDYYGAFQISLPAKIDLHNTAIRFYYVRQEKSNNQEMSTQSTETQYFHFDIPVADNNSHTKESSSRTVAISLKNELPSIPCTSSSSSSSSAHIKTDKIQFFSTIGAVTKISAILKGAGSLTNLLESACKLRLEVSSVSLSSENTSAYYLNPTMKWLEGGNFVLRTSIVGNQDWISVGIKFVSKTPDEIVLDFMLIPLSVGELGIPSIKLEVLETDTTGVAKVVTDTVAHPIALRSNYAVLVAHSLIDLEAVAGKGNVGKVNRMRRVTHFLCYLEEGLSECQDGKDQ